MTYLPSLNTRDGPMVDREGLPSSTVSWPSSTVLQPLLSSIPHSFANTTTSASNVHSSGEFTPNVRNSEMSESQPRCSITPTMSAITETEKEVAGRKRLGMEERSEKSPMAQLIQEYLSVAIESQSGSTEMSITLVLGLEELSPDLIMDRGESGNRRLPCYHLAKATMDNVCMVVTAQQLFLQQASALIVDRKSHFIVDPGDTLIPILQGTSSLPQMHTAWKALITRIKLGVKAWEKYIAEYQLQADVTVLSPLSTFSC